MLEPYPARVTSQAIVLAMAKFADSDGGTLLEETVVAYLTAGVHEGELMTGLLNLVTLLLARIEQLTGRRPADELQRMTTVLRVVTAPA